MGFWSASAMTGSAKTATFLILTSLAASVCSVAIPHRNQHNSTDAVSVEFVTPCRQCSEGPESAAIFDLQILRTTNVCGESNVRLNGQTLAFEWDGVNAFGEALIKTHLVERNKDVDIRLHWRGLCIASPEGSIQDYSVQILAFTFSPAGQDEGRATSGFAVSFNSVNKPEILRLSTEPVLISDEVSILEAWLEASEKNRPQQERLYKGFTLPAGDLEEEQRQFQKLKEQARTLADSNLEKDPRIRAHLLGDSDTFTAQLKECLSVKCFIATFNFIPKMFRMMKHKFGPLPASLAGTPCRLNTRVDQGDAHSVHHTGNNSASFAASQPTASNNNTKPNDSSPSPLPPKRGPKWSMASMPSSHHQLPSASAIITHVIRDFAFVCLFAAIIYMLLKNCSDSLSCRRRRVDMLARREQRRTLQAYRTAACRYRMRQWWNRILGRETVSPSTQSPCSPGDPQQQLDDIQIRSLECGSSAPASEHGAVPNEILGLRRVFEFVGELVNLNSAQLAGARPSRITPQDIIEITAHRYNPATTAPSSTAPLTTIGSPRTSISILSYETGSEDTVDSLDPETATMVSG